MRQLSDLARTGFVPRAVVAIPARDEEACLPNCLNALAAQVDLTGQPLRDGSFGVVLLLNNVRDASAEVVAAARPSLPFPIVVREVTLPPILANAGHARQLAMDAAASWLETGGSTDGFVLTTDADSLVAPDWIGRHFAAFARAADAVAGYVEPDRVELRRLPPALRRRLDQERRFALLLAELRVRLEPRPWDPWPAHDMASGASLGLRLTWYRRVTDTPLPPSSEDRALVQRLVSAGARVRHCPRTRVTTSCRLVGRAEGGMAETLRRRLLETEAACDDALEPVADAMLRRHAPDRERRRLKLSDLPAEIAIARRVLAELRRGRLPRRPENPSAAPARPADSPVCAAPGGSAIADALPV